MRSEYTTNKTGSQDRRRLAEVLQASKGTVDVADAAEALDLSRKEAATLLARWARAGRLSRVRRGLYVPVPIEATSPDVPLDDPWIVASRLFSPCYIGGWSAAEHWDLTEQLFRSVLVLTTQRPRNRKPVLKGTPLLIRRQR